MIILTTGNKVDSVQKKYTRQSIIVDVREPAEEPWYDTLIGT